MSRWLVSLLLWFPLAAAALPPERVQALERGLDDDPAKVQREAAAALEAAPGGSDAAWAAQLRQLLATATLDDVPALTKLLPPALAQAAARGDADAACLLDAARIGFERRAHGPDAAEALALRALASSARRGWCEARLLVARGRMLSGDGRIAQALEPLQRAVALAEAEGDVTLATAAMSDVAWTYKRASADPQAQQRAVETIQATIGRVDGERQRYLAATLHHSLAGIYLGQGRLPEARAEAERAMGYAARIGDALGQAYIGRLIARMDLREGRNAQALQVMTRARAGFEHAGHMDMALFAVVGMAEALNGLGRSREAAALLAENEPLRRRVAQSEADVGFHAAALEANAAQGQATGAIAAARAYAAALNKRERDVGLRTAAEMRERYQSERAAAENQLLRERAAAARARQQGLVASLAMAGLLVVGLGLYLLQQRRLRGQLKVLAESDDLTGLPNRRAILQDAQVLAASRRGGDRPACVALLDIDYFKRVNDRYGHAVGDAALVAFASACRAALRDSDRIGRTGGEEFLLLMPSARPQDAERVFERLRSRLRDTVVPGLAPGERLSFSMGCAALPSGGDAVEALRRADEALYRAKEEGRDRLALAA